MKILIDECLPDELKESVAAMGHECQTARRAGYGSKKNGELLAGCPGFVVGTWVFHFAEGSGGSPASRALLDPFERETERAQSPLE